MAETIGELAVSLIGRMDQLQATLNQAKSDLSAVRGKVEEENTKSSTSWLKLSAAAVAAYAAIKGAALGAVEATKNYALKIDELRDVTGMEEKEASKLVAQLQHFGIESTIASHAAFMLSAQAEHGSEAFEKLGITTRDTNGQIKSGGELFNEVVQALRNETNETTRNALAKELLGRSAVRLADFLKATKGEISDINKTAEKMGIIFGKEAVDAYEHLSFAQNDLKLATTGLARVFGDALLPAVSNFIRTTTELIVGLRVWAEAHKDLIIKTADVASKVLLFLGTVIALGKAVATIEGVFIAVKTAIAAYSAATSIAAGATAILGGELTVIIGLLLIIVEAWGRVSKALGFFDFSISGLLKRTKDYVTSLSEVKTSHDMTTVAVNKNADAIQDLGKKEREVLIDIAKARGANRIAFEMELNEKVKALTAAGVKEKTITQLVLAERGKFEHDYREKRDEAEKKYLEGELAGMKQSVDWQHASYTEKLAQLKNYDEQYKGSLEAKALLEKEYRDLSREADEKRTNEIIGSLTQIRDKTADVFTDAVMGAKSWEDAWKDLGNYIVRDFINTVLKMLINQIIMAIAKAIALKAIMMAFGGGGIGVGTVIGGLAGAAEGGVVTTPTPLWVGEGGEPEAIIPLSKLEQMMGGGGKAGVHIENFNFEHKPNMSFGTPAEMRKAAIQIRYGLQRIGT